MGKKNKQHTEEKSLLKLIPDPLKLVIGAFITNIYNGLPLWLQILIIIIIIYLSIIWLRNNKRILNKINNIYREYLNYAKKRIDNGLDHISKALIFVFLRKSALIVSSYIKYLFLMFIHIIVKIIKVVFWYIIGFGIGCIYGFVITKLFPVNIQRILLSVWNIFWISIIIKFLYYYLRRRKWIFSIIYSLSLIIGIINILDDTYFSNIYSYTINSITKFVIGKSVLPELYMFERGILGLYKSSGRGKRIFPDGTIYEGNFVDNNLNGEGRQIISNGRIYEGDFVNNNLNGEGRITFENGIIYEGNFVDDKLNGEGRITFKNGIIYEGNFADDEPNGEGKIIYINGEIWETN